MGSVAAGRPLSGAAAADRDGTRARRRARRPARSSSPVAVSTPRSSATWPSSPASRGRSCSTCRPPRPIRRRGSSAGIAAARRSTSRRRPGELHRQHPADAGWDEVFLSVDGIVCRAAIRSTSRRSGRRRASTSILRQAWDRGIVLGGASAGIAVLVRGRHDRFPAQGAVDRQGPRVPQRQPLAALRCASPAVGRCIRSSSPRDR